MVVRLTFHYLLRQCSLFLVQDPAAAERRQVVSAALKVLFNLTVEQEVPERMHRKISDESFNEFGRAILAILSHGVEVKSRMTLTE